MPEGSSIMVGAVYEDCSFHPCLCTGVDDDTVEGISLIDGSSPRSCSQLHCGPTALSVDQATRIKANFEQFAALRLQLDTEQALAALQ